MSTGYVSAGRTDRGNVRDHNEDAILMRDDLGLWAVADGLGGHSAGDFASRRVVDRLDALRRAADLSDFIDAIETALCEVNLELRTLAREQDLDIVGSTVALLVCDRDLVMCGWVGDSRVYGFGDGRLTCLTRDHVVGATAAGAPGGALTRAIGADDDLFIDWAVVGRRPGSGFLLCSDGINKEMSDDELAEHCQRHREPRVLVDRVLETALGRAGRDNASAIAVRLEA
ncbi:PP2C family protein-serine/threonine phosphatase [Luteimonas abyssi]|jgi:protein phosphatase|uniref:PP2C family protein-serine/threonine phosphatase n=1 Tax=Luteimonas abyssi TaxID=1247514 RepID=UPI000737B84A|nr:protein phosphatase 2C domain-containing protein [Luteimonas abyssi]